MKISNFFQDEYVNYASYDIYRKIASSIDGQKLSGRKVIHTFIKKNVINADKISRLSSSVATTCEYLHGEQSLCGVMTNMGQDFAGTNNLPLIKREGNFGNRLIPEASAPRYIFTCQEDYFKSIFNSDDFGLLESQTFEGTVIEPKYFIPTIPLLLLNGSNGIATGFRQIIFPRNVNEVINILKDYLVNNKEIPTDILPYYNGFSGSITKNPGNPGSYIISGNIETTDKSNEFLITEIPVGNTIESYISTLDSIIEKNPGVKSYDDLSQDNKFKFKVYVKKEFYVKYSKNIKFLKDLFKLERVFTECYYCINSKNLIQEYSGIKEILEEYIAVRLDFYKRRKDLMIKNLDESLSKLHSTMVFLKMVIDGNINFKNSTVEQIEKLLNKTDKVIKINNSYDYLLNINIRRLSKDELNKLVKQYKTMKEDLLKIKKSDIKELWLTDLKNLEKELS